MRLPIPPDVRALLRGQPWTIAAVAAGLAGAAWLLSPAAIAERARDAHRNLEGRQPNATGQAMGYGAGIFANRVQDPLEVVAMRAAVARAGSNAPTYRGGAGEFYRRPLPTPRQVTWPLAPLQLRGLNAQAQLRGASVQASPAVTRTAAEVLAAQRGGATNG